MKTTKGPASVNIPVGLTDVTMASTYSSCIKKKKKKYQYPIGKQRTQYEKMHTQFPLEKASK